MHFGLRDLITLGILATQIGCDSAVVVNDVQGQCTEPHWSETLGNAVPLVQPDYVSVLETCVFAQTAGTIDVHGVLVANVSGDVSAIASVEGSSLPGWLEIGHDIAIPVGYSMAIPIGGTVSVLAGSYVFALRVASGSPDASVTVLPGTWIEAEVR